MRAFILITLALLIGDLAIPASAQVQPQLKVGVFGGWTEPLPSLPVPPTLRQFLPPGANLRAVIDTHMTQEGETWLLYDPGDNLLEVHLDVVHAGKAVSLFDSEISGGVAGWTAFGIDRKNQMLAFAYHESGDCSDTTFAIFAARAGAYQKIFEKRTDEGRMKIFEDSTEHIEVGSAILQWKTKGSCIWCPHPYLFETYQWQGGQFKRTGSRRTTEQLEPAQIAAAPFVLEPKTSAASNPPQH